ncbi:MAG: serine/threonine-protein kinase [Rubripirellula sp.]
MPEPASNDPLDEAFAAYLRSCDTGEISSREDFLKQYPEIADELSSLIEAADMFGQVTLGGANLMESVKVEPGAETISGHLSGGDESGLDPGATLPMANRPKGDPGPTLPYDLGDYLLLEVIGRGGMGVVYLAKQHELDRDVAVKMIRGGMLADEDDVRRFYTEAQAAARLRHPGIVSVHQFGRRAGHHFFSMEYISGIDLQKKLNAGELTQQEAARYVRDVAWAIHHAHENGVLHRDLKPANVLIDEDDNVHVTDFGLAKHMDSDSSVTGTGAAVGTPHYMAPEQAGGHSDRATHQSDVYSLGAVLFACLTGRPPIVADTVMQTLLQVVHHPAPAVRTVRSDVHMDMETIVAKCLEKNPVKRYESAEHLAAELDAFLEGRPISARPRSRAMKIWHWVEGVPLVGALMGRRVLDTSATHRRVQAAMLLMLLVSPVFAAGLLVMWQRHKDSMPDVVRLAGGVEEGIYNNVSSVLAQRVGESHGVQTQILATSGSLDNRDRLLAGMVDLAPMQATAMSGDHLCVVAPLFHELLYVLAKTDSGIQSIQDLKGHKVAVGPVGSGSRATAELVFASLNLPPEIAPRVVMEWSDLFTEDTPSVAMICIGRGSNLVARLLRDQQWQLVPIPEGILISEQHPTLRPMTIRPNEFQELRGQRKDVPTVGTTAFLAARQDVPAELVASVLDALYLEPSPFLGLIPRSQAAEWQGLAFHPAARRYFLAVTTAK